MRFGRFLLFILVIFCGVFAGAHDAQEGKIFATLGPYFSQTQFVHSTNYPDSPIMPGFGFLAEGDLGTLGGVEIGLFYFQKSYQRTFYNSFTTARADKLSIPAGYRFWLTHWLSTALVLSTSISSGPYQLETVSSLLGDQSTLASNIVEYTLDYSLQWEIWTNEICSVVLDGRYLMSISGNGNDDANQFGLLVGFKYRVREKKEKEDSVN